MARARITCLLSLPLTWMLASAAAMSAGAGEPDWAAATEETLRHLQALLRIDTSNPPGNEAAAARYLASVLQAEGIESELLETAPGRAALLARLPATVPNPAEPLLLMGHIDVVGVDRSAWSADPFGGSVKDGAVWGRGTLDDKGMVAAELETLLLLKRQQVPRRRDVIFLAEPDEEAGGTYGIDALVEKHLDKFRAGAALNEGGRVIEKNGRVAFVGIETSEKISRAVTVVARGVSGHASMPRPDNPVVRLSAAIEKIAAYRAPAKLTPVSAEFFRNLAATESGDTARWMRELGDDSKRQAAADALSRRSLYWNALLRNTVSPTMLEAGIRSNVIPDEARATLNVRLLPGERLEDLVAALERAVGDPQIEFVYERGAVDAAPVSPADSEFFRSVTRAARRMFPEAVVTPYMHQATTDSAPLRERGIEAYGLLVFPLTEEEILLLHGADERLRLGSLRRGVEFLYRVVADFAGAQPGGN